jgi:hypothetical protein
MGALGIRVLRASQRETRLASGTEWHSRIRFIDGRPSNARYYMTCASVLNATTEYPARRNSAVLVICNASSLLIVTTVFSRLVTALVLHSACIPASTVPFPLHIGHSFEGDTLPSPRHVGQGVVWDDIRTASARTVIPWIQFWRRLLFLSLGFAKWLSAQNCTAR